MVNLCSPTDHIIANGRLYNDLDGNYTFISARGSSVTDYLILSKYDTNTISDFRILDFSYFSDHAPIFFSILTKTVQKRPTENESTIEFEHKIVIHDEKIAEFKQTLTRNLNTLNICINSENNTNKQAEALTNFLHEHALQIFGENIPIKTNCASSSPK